MINQTLAHFRITAKLGEGGMGAVYRAQDTKLGRDVALKFLPAEFAEDAERMARFSREAQVLASLNHSNIAGIHSVEEAEAPAGAGDASPGAAAGAPRRFRFLVMELVEGETLEERIARGAMPLEEALRISLQIATGLEEAHERGIIHRDLKPANIKLTPGKQVKILDFGLAKAFDPGPAADPGASGGAAGRLSLSPTMTGMATQAGMLLGTAAYMSPEQARGEAADRRADVWALGVVLMEMLTGKSVHRGNTVSDTLASVLAREPVWDDLPRDTPAPVRRLLERCLEKDARQRLRDVGEFRIAIEHYLADPQAADTVAREETAAAQSAPAWRRALPWAVAGVLAAALAATVLVLRPGPDPPRRPVRLAMPLPEGQTLFTGYGAGTVLAPDGATLVYTLTTGTRSEIRVQALDQWDGRLLVEGTGQGRPYQPFFSPDGQWVGFVTPIDLRKVPVTGGTPIKLCDVERARGATWGPDGTIVFAPSPASPLMQVPAAGGEPRPLTTLDETKGEVTHRWPQWLPGGKGLIFTSHTRTSNFEQASIEVLELATGQRRVVHQGGTYGIYVAGREGQGQVVYANAGSLFAIPFDLGRMEATGSSVPVVENVTFGSPEGSAQFSTSSDGKLVYTTGEAGLYGWKVSWVDREGAMEPLWDEERFYRNPAFSPDGSRLALQILTEGQEDIWVYDVDRAVPTRLTFADVDDTEPVWSPDGLFVYYATEVDGRQGIYRKPADGSGEIESVLALEKEVYPSSISPDGRLLAYMQRQAGNWDVGLVNLEGEPEPALLLETSFIEGAVRFSPNGRWLMYSSNESGQFEVYVRPVQGRGKWQISSGGGSWGVWSSDGSKIYFRAEDSIKVVDVESEGSTFRAGRARPLVPWKFEDTGPTYAYTLAPDGERFVVFQSSAPEKVDQHKHLQFVLNWADELRATLGR